MRGERWDERDPAANVPSPTALAATWDPERIERLGGLLAAECRRKGLRCVRIVHGKGLRSAGREPVLKRHVRKLLARKSEVLAFVEPRAAEGGGGAVVVLLEA